MRNTVMLAPQGHTFEEPQRVRNRRYYVSDHGVTCAMIDGKISTARFEPVGGQALQFVLGCRYFCTLSGDVHDTALRHIPRREAGLSGTQAEVGFLEVEKVVFVEATDLFDDAPTNHHRCA